MKAITFYSYKGGVGRSLALSNMATRLSDLKQKVVVLDFDLEAPGLHFKFGKYKKPAIEKGIVDYIYKFTEEGTVDDIKNYAIELKPDIVHSEPIQLISAGNIQSDAYWSKLANIQWRDLFYTENAQGVRFFLDLKERIHQAFNPDYLLIDSRTGITDISGITLRLLADKIVLLAANNEENRDGCYRILRSIINSGHELQGHAPKLHYVITRVPFTNEALDRQKERALLTKEKAYLNTTFTQTTISLSLIHSDRRLEEREQNYMGIEKKADVISIENDYLELFETIIAEDLDARLVEAFTKSKKAEELYNKAIKTLDLNDSLAMLNEAIALDTENYLYYFHRGWINSQLKNFEDSNRDYLKSLGLNPDYWYTLNNLAYNFEQLNKLEDTLHYFKLAMALPYNIQFYSSQLNYIDTLLRLGRVEEARQELSNFNTQYTPKNSEDFNTRANIYRRLKEYDLALKDAYSAINMDSNIAENFGTLAEIKYDMGNEEEFYINFALALGKGISASALNSAKDIYQKVKHEVRFLDLLDQYDISLDEVLK